MRRLGADEVFPAVCQIIMTARAQDPATAHLSAGRKAARTRRAWARERIDDLSPEQLAVLRLARRAASAALGRARQVGIPCGADFNCNLRAQLDRQDWCCALTGIPFSEERTSAGAGGRDLAPSPDRIDPGSGYVSGNVQWILWCINRAKGRMPEHHFEHVFRELGRALGDRRTQK